MNLIKTLRNAGYDLIDSPIRNHKPLQLWKKTPFNEVSHYYEHISHAFDSGVELSIYKDEALSVDFSQTKEYKFNIGITILDNLLTSLGLGNLGISGKFTKGKKVSISYDNSNTHTVSTGEISNYLSSADFRYSNPELLNNANKDNILVISGVLTAKSIKVTLETDTEISVDTEASLTEMAEGKATFNLVNSKTLEMKSEANRAFPIAVNANRIDWDKGAFKKLVLVTDNRNFF